MRRDYRWRLLLLVLLFCQCAVAQVISWTGIRNSIPTSGPATIVLGAATFNCDDYDSQITIPTGTSVTIHGNNATLDAAQKGRFFQVNSGAALALDHLVLQNGVVSKGGAIFNAGTLHVTWPTSLATRPTDTMGAAERSPTTRP